MAAVTRRRNPAGMDLRSVDDRGLWLRRRTYEAETNWAPRHVGKELRQVARQVERDHGRKLRKWTGARG
jgi:hypothetical protein